MSININEIIVVNFKEEVFFGINRLICILDYCLIYFDNLI